MINNLQIELLRFTMDPMRITVLETYDLKFCCVCTQNGANFYFNIFENVIVYVSAYMSLAQIIIETLGFNVSASLFLNREILFQSFNFRYNEIPINFRTFASVAKPKLSTSSFSSVAMKKLARYLKIHQYLSRR